MVNITQEHLEFLEEAKVAFFKEPRMFTYRNREDNLIALRIGEDRDCIMVYELGKPVANFTQQSEKRVEFRPELWWFAEQMEIQLQENEHKGGWQNSSNEFLAHELQRNLARIRNTSVSKVEFRRRCANIANYAMMLADNDRRR